jgi:hypothetical protein
LEKNGKMGLKNGELCAGGKRREDEGNGRGAGGEETWMEDFRTVERGFEGEGVRIMVGEGYWWRRRKGDGGKAWDMRVTNRGFRRVAREMQGKIAMRSSGWS